jgi:hypothetical protein
MKGWHKRLLDGKSSIMAIKECCWRFFLKEKERRREPRSG